MFPQLRLDTDKLREELTDYQVADSKELPQEQRVDRLWGLVGKDERFSQLARLMKALLCIPHSNASSERTFSMVKTNCYRELNKFVQQHFVLSLVLQNKLY